MPKQFIRIYVLIIVTVVSLLIVAGTLFDAITEKENSYQLSVNQIFSQYRNTPEAKIVKPVSIENIDFPPSIRDKLRLGQIIPVSINENQVMYYQWADDQLFAFGPFVDESSAWQQLNQVFAWLFYGVLAVAFVMLLYPIGRDILLVQRHALRFSRKPQKLSIDVKAGSSVYPLASTLEQMSARIVDLLEMQRDLSNTVAHEIRTPLSRMEFVLQHINEHVEEKYSQRLQKDIAEINLLVTDYLEFARSQHQQPILAIIQSNKHSLIASLQDKFSVYQSAIEIEMTADELPSHFDPKLLEIAIQNLLANALRFAERKIRLSWKTLNGVNQLTVSDDGQGLSGKQAGLKQAFKRGSQDSKDLGFGLGLYITHQIARRHNGELCIDEDQNLGGARFTIEWPEETTS